MNETLRTRKGPLLPGVVVKDMGGVRVPSTPRSRHRGLGSSLVSDLTYVLTHLSPTHRHPPTPSPTHLLTHPLTHPPIPTYPSPTHLPVHVLTYPIIHLPTFPPTPLPIHIPTHLPTHPATHPPTYQPIHPHTYPPTYLPTHPPTHPPVQLPLTSLCSPRPVSSYVSSLSSIKSPSQEPVHLPVGPKIRNIVVVTRTCRDPGDPY